MAVPFRSEILEYYSRHEILEEMMKISGDREFCGALGNGAYQKRPNVIQFPSDITQMVKAGVTSFHCSVERWKNPMQLSTTDRNYAPLRKGFDFLIDIDSKLGSKTEERIQSSQLCATEICSFLRSYGIKNYGVKFSGSRGFHIIVPWEAFPQEVDGNCLFTEYPRVPQILAGFIREELREKMTGILVGKYSAKNLMEISNSDSIDPYSFVEIEKGWGERHLFRAPYSLNEKTWFISLPLRDPVDYAPEKVLMKNVRVSEKFIKPCEENEAKELLRDALNWNAEQEDSIKRSEITVKKRESYQLTAKVPEEHFPPCIKTILAGLEDGKKRSLFTLINFLKSMNWPMEEIEQKLNEWNARNPKPLPSSIIIGQVNYAYHRQKAPPANCSNELYYKSIGICNPDEICKNVKNPATYPFKKPGTNLTTKPMGRFVCRECGKDCKDQKSLAMHQNRSHRDSIE